MEQAGEEGVAGRLLPADARRCVWMTAGIVAYKICDRDFDCEHCPLDAGLRGEGRREPADEAACATGALDFPTDRLYHASHTWVRPLEASRVRCGADAFAASLLSPATSIVLPAPGAVLRQGRIGCWILSDHRVVPLVSPVTGTVHRRNPRVQELPALLVGSPYGEGWLVEVDCPEWDEQRRRLVDADRQRESALRQSSALRRQVAQSLETPALGPTMADGGEPLTDLRRLLGEDRYHRLVRRLLR